MSRNVTQMTIDDAEHYTPERRAEIIASYPEYEREARTKGIPIMGTGRVFPIPEEDVFCDPFEIPRSWPRIGGLDFGWDHPFAATSLAWDRDADRIYVDKEYAARESTPVIHAAALKPWGAWLPWAWPHDGLQHDKGSGEALKAQYEAQGLNMLADKATFEDGSNGVEAGIFDMLDRMKTGRFKVFKTCVGWLGEFRLYHREKGLIVKLKDDRISSSRYALMMLRNSTVEQSSGAIRRNIRGIV